MTQSRRDFLRTTLAAGAGLASLTGPVAAQELARKKEPLFKISPAEWSLHRTLQSKKMTPLD